MSTQHETWGISYSGTYRRLADEAAARATADLSNLAKHRMPDGGTLTHTPRAAEAVLLAALALEAGINEIAVFLRQWFIVPLQPVPDDFMSQGVQEKWATIPRSMVGREPPRGEQPWQDLDALIGLRNELAHFKWRGERVPRFMRALQARHLIIQAAPGIYWFDAALTDRVARWATQTCDRVFAALAELVDRAGDDLWPWQ